MLKRDWNNGFALGIGAGGILAIFCLVWLVGLNYCPGDPCTHNETPSENPTYNEPYIPFGVGPNTTSGFEPEDTKGNAHYYERQDLRAQESVARATNSLVWLTFGSAIVGILGIGLLVWTLTETRSATNETRISNQIMREEQRPWLLVDKIEISNYDLISHVSDSGKKYVKLIGVCYFKNVGNSVAFNCYCWAKACPFGHDELKESLNGFGTMKSSTHSGQATEPIFPNQSRPYEFFACFPIEDFDHPLMTWFIHCAVTYKSGNDQEVRGTDQTWSIEQNIAGIGLQPIKHSDVHKWPDVSNLVAVLRYTREAS